MIVTGNTTQELAAVNSERRCKVDGKRKQDEGVGDVEVDEVKKAPKSKSKIAST